ncbi:MAG: hypothetical protein LUQ66_08220 [Methanoregula sp.]|nr:hypothetical protein [Methanoregula sp.]
MGRGKAAYILKVESELNGTELKTAIIDCINSHKIVESGNKKNRKGFRNINIDTENLGVPIPEFYFRDINHTSIQAVYQEYYEDIDRFSKDVQYRPMYLDITYDYHKRTLIIFNSSIVEVHKILSILNSCVGDMHFQPPNYANSANVEFFIRWLIENSKNHRDKFPPSCKLLSIEGTKVTDLDQSPTHSTSESANLKSSGDLADDHLYEQVKDEGLRDYIKCIFLHSRFAIKTYIYRNGKINLISRPPKITEQQYSSLFPIIFEEMENLYNFYIQDTGGDE